MCAQKLEISQIGLLTRKLAPMGTPHPLGGGYARAYPGMSSRSKWSENTNICIIYTNRTWNFSNWTTNKKVSSTGYHGYARALFFDWVDVTFTFGVFPKYLGPKWPTITWKWLKGSVWGDFLDPRFACFGLFWHLIGAPLSSWFARDQNFLAQGGPSIYPNHPLQDKWNPRKWEPELVPLFCHAVLSSVYYYYTILIGG